MLIANLGTCQRAGGDQKKALDHMELEVQVIVPYGCWDMNPGPLEGQPVTEPSAQSPVSDIYLFSFFSKIGVFVF